MTFQGAVSGVTVKDEVWVTGTDLRADRVVGKYWTISNNNNIQMITSNYYYY